MKKIIKLAIAGFIGIITFTLVDGEKNYKSTFMIGFDNS